MREKRFQECNWLVKLWRYRHYLYVPFKFISYKLRGPQAGFPGWEPNNRQLWSILVGSAQCDMNWVYTNEEVMERLNQNKDENGNKSKKIRP